jgi:pimeloyl-ACP methyl ester carboxylesterase
VSIAHRFVETNGIRMHLAEAGSGAPVVLCHGFPESWYSWRHQLQALAKEGFRAIAPDMRGYGQTDKPEAIDQYTLFHLTGDVIGLLDALNIEKAAIIGHDWGAPVASHCALFRPDRFASLATLSVPPFRPRSPARPTSLMPKTENAQFYQLYFQKPGEAEAEFEANVERTLRLMLFYSSGDAPTAGNSGPVGMVPIGRPWLADIPPPQTLPAWLSEADIKFYTVEFARSGFRGGLNWYRNIDRNWELLAPWKDAKLQVPTLYIVGDRDLVFRFPGMDTLIPKLKNFVPKLERTVLLEGCGHWTQQERVDQVSREIIRFLQSINFATNSSLRS